MYTDNYHLAHKSEVVATANNLVCELFFLLHLRTVLVDKCRTNICSKIGTCRKLGVDTVCVCPPYTSGLNCENSKGIVLMTCTIHMGIIIMSIYKLFHVKFILLLITSYVIIVGIDM